MVDDKGARVLVDPKAVVYLLGAEMDYRVDRLSSRFVFNNPKPFSPNRDPQLLSSCPRSLASRD